MNLLIFTDLDGSLLDHEDYSYEGARPALERIVREGWPLIFVTSKTRVEVEDLQTQMGIESPFIVENGAAAFFPPLSEPLHPPDAKSCGRYRVMVWGRPYREIRSFVERVRTRFGIRGFGDMDVEEIAGLTRLPVDAAARASQREFTEPFTLLDTADLGELKAEADRYGLTVTAGGRLHHLIGRDQSKGRAVRAVQEVFAPDRETEVLSIGFGDAPNDLPMLQAVDIPVVIPHAGGRPLRLPRGGDPGVTATHPGSRGWNDAFFEVIMPLVPADERSGRNAVTTRTEHKG